jgi:hypothetical protein
VGVEHGASMGAELVDVDVEEAGALVTADVVGTALGTGVEIDDDIGERLDERRLERARDRHPIEQRGLVESVHLD